MALNFNFGATFKADGTALIDKTVLDALHIKSESNTFHLTQTINRNPKEVKEVKEHNQHKQNPALTIEECVPEGDYREGKCIPLPSNVSENSIFNNIIASFKHDFDTSREKEVRDLKEVFRQRRCVKDVNQYVNYNKTRDEVQKEILGELDKEEERQMRLLEDKERRSKKKLEEKLEVWKTYLKLEQNKHVLADSFWFMRYYLMMQNDIMVNHVDPDVEAIEIYVFLQGRMAKNYIDLFLTVSETDDNNKKGSTRAKTSGNYMQTDESQTRDQTRLKAQYKDSFFKNYFNILSQGVFYSFFYACPKSRDKLNDEMKEMFLSEFSTIFAGIEVTNLKDYYSTWYLDLGAGNILKNDNNQEEEIKDANSVELREERVPTINTKVARTKQEMRYSSIIETYLSSENFKTRNVVKGYQMNFSKLIHPKKTYNKDNEDAQTKKILEGFQLEFSKMVYRRNIAKKNMVSVDEVERVFEEHRRVAKEVNENLKQFEEEDKKAKKALILERKRLKEDCKKHQRRLSRRRDEELEKGAHEYANYLVSMLNAHSQTGGGIQKL